MGQGIPDEFTFLLAPNSELYSGEGKVPYKFRHNWELLQNNLRASSGKAAILTFLWENTTMECVNVRSSTLQFS